MASRQQPATSNALSRKVRELERRLEAVEDRLGMEYVEAPVSRHVRAAPAKAEPRAAPSKPIENLGFKLFGAVGFFLILLALFYFYRYAVDQGWIGVGARVALGVMFSLAVIGAGELFKRRKQEKFAQLLMGGGIALLYFTVFATYHFPSYRAALHMTTLLNTALLLAVVAGGIWLALRESSQLLAAFAFMLGYVAAALPASSQTFIAVVVLSAGVIYVIQRTGWQLTPYTAAVAFIVYTIAFFAADALDNAGVARIAAASILLLVALFTGVSPRLRPAVQQILTASLAAFAGFIFLLALVKEYAPAYDSLFTTLLALIYGTLWFVSAKRRGANELSQTFFVIASTLFTLAVPMQLDRGWIAIVWSAEAVALLYLGSRTESTTIKILGYSTLALATASSLAMTALEEYPVRTLVLLANTAAAFIAARFVKTNSTERTVLLVGGAVLALITINTEVSDPDGLFRWLSREWRSVLATLLWCAEGVLLVALGRREALRTTGHVLLGLAVLQSFVTMLVLDHPFRTVTLLIIAAALIVAGRLQRDSWRQVYFIAAGMFFAIVLAVEVGDGEGVLRILSDNARQVLLSVVWAVLAVAMLVQGVREKMPGLRAVGLGLFSITVLKVLLIDLSDLSTLYRVLVTLVVGLLALGVSFLYVRHKGELEKLLTK